MMILMHNSEAIYGSQTLILLSQEIFLTQKTGNFIAPTTMYDLRPHTHMD